VHWPANSSAEDDLYYRLLIARYSAYPNVTWDLAKEAQYEKDLSYKTSRLRFIRANDSLSPAADGSRRPCELRQGCI